MDQICPYPFIKWSNLSHRIEIWRQKTERRVLTGKDADGGTPAALEINGEVVPSVFSVHEEVNGVQLDERRKIMVTTSSFVSCIGERTRLELWRNGRALGNGYCWWLHDESRCEELTRRCAGTMWSRWRNRRTRWSRTWPECLVGVAPADSQIWPRTNIAT
jgi:hypothetical protein